MKKFNTIIYQELILEKINKIIDLPKDWKEGSVLLTENKKVFFEITRKYK